jgi:hypothetical protein
VAGKWFTIQRLKERKHMKNWFKNVIQTICPMVRAACPKTKTPIEENVKRAHLEVQMKNANRGKNI